MIGSMARTQRLQFEHVVQIAATPTQVLAAFFDPEALAAWWKATRAVTTPRPLGIYAVEWQTSPFRDDVLGSLGGVFYGTVMEFRNGREFFLADAYWLPPQSPPIGPMALEVSCRVRRTRHPVAGASKRRGRRSPLAAVLRADRRGVGGVARHPQAVPGAGGRAEAASPRDRPALTPDHPSRSSAHL